MGDDFLTFYFVLFGGIALLATVVVIFDKIGQRQQRKRREKRLDADGHSVRA